MCLCIWKIRRSRPAIPKLCTVVHVGHHPTQTDNVMIHKICTLFILCTCKYCKICSITLLKSVVNCSNSCSVINAYLVVVFAAGHHYSGQLLYHTRYHTVWFKKKSEFGGKKVRSYVLQSWQLNCVWFLVSTSTSTWFFFPTRRVLSAMHRYTLLPLKTYF